MALLFPILSNHAKHRKPARLGKGANGPVIAIAGSRNNGTPVCLPTGAVFLPIEAETTRHATYVAEFLPRIARLESDCAIR